MLITSHNSPYAELHLHLGGSLHPRIMYHRLTEVERSPHIRNLGYKSYEEFESFFRAKREDLDDYLKMHELVEPIQSMDRLRYFIKRLMRGAYEFEGLYYIELRYCPYSRTNENLSIQDRIAQMRSVVEIIDKAIKDFSTKGKAEEYYPIIIKQILCMHSQMKYTPEINKAILELAIEMKDRDVVVGLDIAGGEKMYMDRFDEILNNFKTAQEFGLHTTAHLFETSDSYPEFVKLFKYLDRIGHGIQMATKNSKDLLKEAQGKCLEICPTTYIKCGLIKELAELQIVFERCDRYKVDVTICTDNSGMHLSRLPNEYENLLIHKVIEHDELQVYRKNAFKYAWGLSQDEKDAFIKNIDQKTIEIKNSSQEINKINNDIPKDISKSEMLKIISTGNLRGAIMSIQEFLIKNGKTENIDTIIHLSARAYSIQDQKNKDIISEENYEKGVNKITESLLDYIRNSKELL